MNRTATLVLGITGFGLVLAGLLLIVVLPAEDGTIPAAVAVGSGCVLVSTGLLGKSARHKAGSPSDVAVTMGAEAILLQQALLHHQGDSAHHVPAHHDPNSHHVNAGSHHGGHHHP